MSAFVLVNVLQVRLEEIVAVATVERAMGVKRALNAHQQPGEGVDISQMSTSGWKYVHKVQLQQISLHTVLVHNKFLLTYIYMYFALDLSA